MRLTSTWSVVVVGVLLAGCQTKGGNPLAPNALDSVPSLQAQHVITDVPMAATEASVGTVTLPVATNPLTNLPGGAQARLDVYGPALECGHGMAAPNMEYIETADGRTYYRFAFANTGSGVRIGYIVFQDDSGRGKGDNGPCGLVVHHPTGGYMRLVSGAWTYGPNQSNVETVLEFLAHKVPCGRVQIDIAINRMLVVGQLRRVGKDCEPPPPVVVMPPSVPRSPLPPTEEPPVVEEPVCETDCTPPPPETCETNQALCPPPPPPPVLACVAGPYSYDGPATFSLANSGDATELAYVNSHVSPGLFTGPTKTSLTTTTWTSDGNYAVVLVKSGTTYRLYVNVTVGQVLQSPGFNPQGKQQAISHVSTFACAVVAS